MIQFYWNYYALGYLLLGIFTVSLLLLLLGVKNKSSATKLVIASLIATSLLSLSYAVSFGFIEPFSAYHRWITYSVGNLFPLIISALFLKFPKDSTPRFSKYFFTIFVPWTILASVLFIIASWNLTTTFNSSSENFDFNDEAFNKKFTPLILINVIMMMLIGLIKVIQDKQNRGAYLFFILSITLTTIVPAILNVMSRSGILERTIFIKFFCILGITGFFILFASYLNYTTDPSSFMTKIVAISAAFLFVILEFVAYETLKDHALKYEKIAIQELQLHSKGILSERILEFEETSGVETEAKIVLNSKGLPVYQISIPGFRANFPYLDYRKEMHNVSLPLVMIVTIATILIFSVFPLFFHHSLVKPLQNLLVGVGEVNKGNLDTNIEPRIEDEIGFLTKSFNQMIYQIKLAQEKLQEHANELEEKVEERTKDLKSTLEQVQDLKNQQDGDYFLTSMLLKPLNMNKAKEGNTTVEFLTSQKKKFQFKGWKEEIGGDLCMSNSIVLRGTRYTVFLNADAMGKSLQGAGGALVLGSVFESILNRSKVNKQSRDYYPEKWMKYAFLELHQVFETFDGTMLVSMVMGMIDDESGLLYSINVEHPWSVLLRDGKASFINTKKPYRKLGTLGAEGNIIIHTMQLQSGDVIIAGSDGRDDIMMDLGQGQKGINEDDDLFLNYVEEFGGDLEKIYERILASGEVIDDITFVKVSYNNPRQNQKNSNEDEVGREVKELIANDSFSEAESILESQLEKNFSPKMAKILFQMQLKIGNFKKASEWVSSLVRTLPSETGLLFQAAYCERKSGNYLSAIDLGERVKLRQPKHFKNLINLADSYYYYGNKERANYLLSLAKKLDEKNPHLIRRWEAYGKEIQS